MSVTEILTWCKNCRKKFYDIPNRRGGPKKYCCDNCRKRYYDQNNRWKIQDQCPRCGGVKSKKAKHCKACYPHNNSEGRNQFSY